MAPSNTSDYIHDLAEYHGRLWGLPSNCLIVSCIVIIIYEHVFTAHEEYRVIWRRSLSAPAVLFFINRYALLVLSIMYLATCFAWWPVDYRYAWVVTIRIRCP
ncbi:hypothetical protein C8Q76DRAFT_230265 [Earliella scabrosa]|nr:hypothetical protein C8Q76DRAFT_230265 [Earliella scabrosa]